MISPILGHKIKGIDASYSEHNYSELLLKFKMALPYLIPQNAEAVKVELETVKADSENKIRKQEVKIIEMNDSLKKSEQKIETQDSKLQELNDYLAGLDSAITDLKLKHPDLTNEDLQKLKEPLQKSIDRINDKMALMLNFLSAKYPELKQGASQ